jgi:hypothetical protein
MIFLFDLLIVSNIIFYGFWPCELLLKHSAICALDIIAQGREE